MQRHLVYLFPLLLLSYSVYSFAHVDPNLVLSSSFSFWDFQQFMWQLGYHNRPLSTGIFLGLVVSLFVVYGIILHSIAKKRISLKEVLVVFGLSIFALLPSYPALSHDIFNYLFNAKMVVVYGANPHIQVAMDFYEDPWLRFMHNIHTPAPYGYGWTAFSLVPFLAANQHLQLSMLMFRAVMIFSLVGLLWLLYQLQPKKDLYLLGMLAFNPLVLIETIGNIHNDVVMMALAMLALWLMHKRWQHKLIGLLAFIFSVSIKYASVVVTPALGLLAVGKQHKYWGLITSVLLFLPLLTDRSQRFLPWYLIWSLTFLPLIHVTWWRTFLMSASFAGLVSYGLILYHGEYSPELLTNRSVILFSIPIIYTSFVLLRGVRHR